jgi:hypothetical protein
MCVASSEFAVIVVRRSRSGVPSAWVAISGLL